MSADDDLAAAQEQPRFTAVAKRWSTLLLVGGTLLIVLSAIGFWIQQTVMTEDNFVQLTSQVLTSQAARDAIATSIVDQLLAERPILQGLVRDPLESAIASLLDTAFFRVPLEFIAHFIWETLFINNASVVLDIAPLRDFVFGIISALAPQATATLSPDQLPDQIVLIEFDELQDIQRIESSVTWLTWLFLIGGLGLIGYGIGRAWRSPGLRWALIGWTGIFLAGWVVLAFILSYPARSTLVVAVDNQAGRVIVGETYDALIQRLHAGLGVLFVLALILTGLCFYMRRQLDFAKVWRRSPAEPAPAAPAEPALATE
jgi:hypothetical protein